MENSTPPNTEEKIKCYLCGMPMKDHTETKILAGTKFRCSVRVKLNRKDWRFVFGSEANGN